MAIAASSLARGLAEAGVLVLVARIALALSEGTDTFGFSLGPLGGLELPIGSALALAGGLALTMFALHLWTASLSSRVSADALQTTRCRLSEAFLQSAWSVQSAEQGGHLQEVLTTHADRAQTGATLMATTLTALFNLCALIGVAVLLNPKAAAGLVASVVLLSLMLRPVAKSTRRRAVTNRNANTTFATQMTEVVGLAQEITVFDVGPAVTEQLRASAAVASQATRRVHFVRQLLPGVYQSLAILLVLGGLGLFYAAGPGNLASIGAVVLLLLRSIAYGQQLQVAGNTLIEMGPYLRSLRAEEDRYRASAPQPGGDEICTLDVLELVGVGYRYDNQQEALHGVSLGIRRGDVVGLVGPSGSGKSTLIQLLLRLRPPTEGVYRINGRPAESFSFHSWYPLLAVVPQQPRLFEATVTDNIRFFREELTTADIESAARRAHIHDEILSWPDGYDTVFHGIGSGVSGGQAQRLCIARALAGRPQFLVLDEPTSALDVHSEALIQQTLAEIKGEVTLVVIAHRLSTLRMCHKIIVLKDGRLEDFDTPEVLERENDYYREAIELSRAG